MPNLMLVNVVTPAHYAVYNEFTGVCQTFTF